MWNESIGEREQLIKKLNKLNQINPRFGLHGSNLWYAYPEIIENQISSIFMGAEIAAKNNINVNIRLLFPDITDVKQVVQLNDMVHKVAETTNLLNNKKITVKTGAIIETPRAAIVADKLSENVDFLYINTNSLTESVFGFAFEDSQKYMPQLIEQKVYPDNPFCWYDKQGVGSMIRQACEKVHSRNSEFEIVLLGNHVEYSDAMDDYGPLVNAVCCNPSQFFDIRLGLAQSFARNKDQ